MLVLKKNELGYKSITGAKLINSLKRYIDKDTIIKLIIIWKEKNYLDYDNSLGPQSVIKILREDGLIESINSCKP